MFQIFSFSFWCLYNFNVEEICGGEISATIRGHKVAQAPTHNPITNLPIMSAKKLNIKVIRVNQIIITDNQISTFLLPYLRKGPTSSAPSVAPNGISPFKIELNKSSLWITYLL